MTRYHSSVSNEIELVNFAMGTRTAQDQMERIVWDISV
jgi:hypothetical protein